MPRRILGKPIDFPLLSLVPPGKAVELAKATVATSTGTSDISNKVAENEELSNEPLEGEQ